MILLKLRDASDIDRMEDHSCSTHMSPRREGLEARCPEHVEVSDWQQAGEDGRATLARWGDQAERLGRPIRSSRRFRPPPTSFRPSLGRSGREQMFARVPQRLKFAYLTKDGRVCVRSNCGERLHRSGA
jgi:hypothetical protein